jgi:light-harvesting complex I chlorophyll a/b binding protein 3
MHATLELAAALRCPVQKRPGLILPLTAIHQVLWWRSGVIPPLGTYKSYWMDPFSLFWIEVILVQFAELKR